MFPSRGIFWDSSRTGILDALLSRHPFSRLASGSHDFKPDLRLPGAGRLIIFYSVNFLEETSSHPECFGLVLKLIHKVKKEQVCACLERERKKSTRLFERHCFLRVEWKRICCISRENEKTKCFNSHLVLFFCIFSVLVQFMSAGCKITTSVSFELRSEFLIHTPVVWIFDGI